MDHQGNNQNPQKGVVGSGGQMPYGSNPYQSNPLQQQLQAFWENQIQEIENVTDIKNHSLPLARIKKIMKADEDVKMISAEAPVLFAKACELFISELTLRSWNHTEENKRR
ncbi:nuclear transcription factor Y subunit C-9, partial [Trifolium medium]|nr:nuclear transcription factor Y subunit C-9 [Trifolium medium]